MHPWRPPSHTVRMARRARFPAVRMSSSESRFARLRREARATFVLSLPLVLGQLSQVAMNLVDTVMAGHHGRLTQAEVAVGTQIWSLAIVLSIGVLMAVPPFVSQLNGGNRRGEIGALFRQTLWLSLALGVGLLWLTRQADALLGLIGIADEVRPGAAAYLQAISWGAPALTLFFCFRYLCDGVAWTVPAMICGFAGLVALVPANYLFLYGGLGIPAMGTEGLAWASALVLWGQAMGFLVYLLRSPRFADLSLFAHFEWPRRATIGALLWVGVPMGVSIFMEGSLFVVTGLLIGTLGATEIAAHQIALVLASTTFMVPLGVAMATTVRVGHAVGADDAPAVRWAAGAGYAIALFTQTVSALAMVLGGGMIAWLFTRDAATAALAATLLMYAAAFQYVDGVQVLSNGALRGLKDTRVPMVITAFSYWGLGMPLGWVLGMTLGWGPQGLWMGLILGLSAAAVLLTLRFLRIGRDPLGYARRVGL